MKPQRLLWLALYFLIPTIPIGLIFSSPLAQLDDRPSAPITARFGAAAATRLNRVLGREDVRIRPERPALIVSVDRMRVEPITVTSDIEAVIGDLLAEVKAVCGG
jgi:hypothetical protein